VKRKGEKVEKQKYHKYCLRCGRKLKSDKSRLLGFGEVCYKKQKTDKRKPLF